MEGPSASRVALWVLAAAGVALPFLCVTFPPATDLPQHVAQARLLFEALERPEGPYEIQPFTPYWTVYALLAALWALLDPLNVGRVGLLVLGVLWTAGVNGLAWRRGRAAESAVLASLPFFSHVLYWGFAPFLMGWPAYLGWLQLVTRSERMTVARAVLFVAVGALLFWSHALWFAAALCTWAVVCGVLRRPLRTVFLEAAALAPLVALAVWWYPRLARAGFSSRTHWFTGLFDRLSWRGLTEGTFGGLRDSIEGPVLALLLLWMAAGVWQHRRELRARVDPGLLTAALLLLLASLALPDKHSNTLQFASRWMPFAVALMLLALPAPRMAPLPLRAIALSIAALFLVFTTVTWRAFERTELSGLEASLARIPPGSSVLGLDFLKESALVRGRPFLQTFAYAHVLRGAVLNFSFADFAPSPVVFREPRRPPWTPGLEWYAERVQPGDFARFDAVLIGGRPATHEAAVRHAGLQPLTQEGVWRLYEAARSTERMPGQQPR